ncbi:primase-helicase zinc-binding domain-containing protein [Verrucomicrobium spinosum]|uniref:primase-helicase zinc-binding domain-containing protein n=1 Tax=Verrucomicrobium spinosum TaxID=2736 RepID=UPI000946167E|nr:primase-helicase zinc-binding domain-containing protein [Verrucomicrobium spinosum]
MESDENPRGWYQAEDVRQAANGRWVDVLARFGVPTDLLTGKHCRCPGCGGRDRFRFDDRDGDGTFFCSQGGGGNLSGDGLMLLAHVTRWEWKRCVEEVGRYLLPDAVRTSHTRRLYGPVEPGVAPRPTMPAKEKRPPFDLAKLERFVEGVQPIDREWLSRRSPKPVQNMTAADFIETMYSKDERVLIFTSEYSQGDFIHRSGFGSYRLAAERGVKAVPSALPTTGRCGVWFLTNPVTGQWENKATKIRHGDRAGELNAEWTRRSWPNITSWRHMILESDEAPEELWLRALVKLALPVVAIYSSGKRSLHALVRVDAGSKVEWDAIRDFIGPMLAPIGADPGALSAVRLSRLPCCFREGYVDKKTKQYIRFPKPQLQELVYLHPEPPMNQF